jgi:hypothetical protein
MKSISTKGVIKAAERKHNKNKSLGRFTVLLFDYQFTSKQLHQYWLDTNYQNKQLVQMKFKSFTDRLSRNGLIKYDQSKKIWINLFRIKHDEEKQNQESQ